MSLSNYLKQKGYSQSLSQKITLGTVTASRAAPIFLQNLPTETLTFFMLDPAQQSVAASTHDIWGMGGKAD